MQQVFLYSQINEYSNSINKKALRFIKEKESESYIGFSDFNVMFFDVSFPPKNNKIAIYLDKQNLFFICDNNDVKTSITNIITDRLNDENIENEHLLYHFFMSIIRTDNRIINKYEAIITDTEEIINKDKEIDRQKQIMQYRRELWQMRRKYEQIGIILAQMISNGNKLLSKNGIKYMTILDSRVDKLLSGTAALRDYLAQVQDEYQSILDYRQNNLMKVFTVVTSIFSPLSLIAGWYGMNFDMPEFSYQYGYYIVIAVSILTSAVLIIIFKKKKWM